MKIPFVTSQAGVEYAYEDDPYFETIFVLEQFEGDVFNNLKSTDNRILGPPVINAIAETNEVSVTVKSFWKCYPRSNRAFLLAYNFYLFAVLFRLVFLPQLKKPDGYCNDHRVCNVLLHIRRKYHFLRHLSLDFHMSSQIEFINNNDGFF